MAQELVIDLGLGQSQTGLALRAQIYDTAGATVGGLISTGFTEFGRGTYQFYHAAYSDAFAAAGGSVVFTVSGAPTVPLASVALNAADFGLTNALSLSGIAAAVWAYITRTITSSAAQTAADVAGGDLAILRGDTWDEGLTGLGSLAGRSKLWFTVKVSEQDADSAAILQIEESAGLVYFNGAPATAGDGSLTVTNATTGALTLHLIAARAAELVPATGLYYDCQVKIGSQVSTLLSGHFHVNSDVTRAVA